MDFNELSVIYGNNPCIMTKKILEEVRPTLNISKDGLIGLKPNLILPKTADSGATTSPDVVRGVIDYLIDKGYKNIIILESSWVGDSTEKAFKVCGYEEIAKDYNIPLIDLKKDKGKEVKWQGTTINVCQKALEVECLINIPVLKAHCQTKLTCALKNLKGCIPDKEKRRFHSLGLHKPIALLNKVLKSHLIVVDAIMGDLTFEEGGNPVEMGRVIVGTDPVLIDSYAAELIGLEVSDIPYIELANKMGVGQLYDDSTFIYELERDKMPTFSLKAGSKVDHLSQWVEEKDSCSPCYASLIHALNRLEEKGKLKMLNNKIYIGRGFNQTKKDKHGIGLCTKEFSRHVPGCPPKTKEIMKFLEEVVLK